VDPVAVSYVLQNSDSFQKSELLRFSLGTFTGRGMHDSPLWSLIRLTSSFISGVLFVEGTFRKSDTDMFNQSYCIRTTAQKAGKLRICMPFEQLS
jgi:hypothetical protein